MAPSIFISYSRKDVEIARYIYDDLVKCNIDVFIDDESLNAGDAFYARIAQEIEERDVILFLVSQDSVVSRFVIDEVLHGHKHQKRIIPLRLDNAIIPKDIFFIGSVHQQQFERSQVGLKTLYSALGMNDDTYSINPNQSVNDYSTLNETVAIASSRTVRRGSAAYRERVIKELEEAQIQIDFSNDPDIHFYALSANGTRIPIAVRGSARKGFALSSVYEKIPRLLITYVWGMEPGYEQLTFALTYTEAYKIIETRQLYLTSSWREGNYSVSNVPPEVESYLKRFRMSSKTWRAKLEVMATSE